MANTGVYILITNVSHCLEKLMKYMRIILQRNLVERSTSDLVSRNSIALLISRARPDISCADSGYYINVTNLLENNDRSEYRYSSSLSCSLL